MLLAIREIRRAKLRFSLLTGAVALLVFLILFQQTIGSSLVEGFTGALERNSADVLVYNEDARRNVEGSALPPATVEQVAAVDGVASAAPVGESTVTARVGDEDRDIVVWGYVLDAPDTPGAPTNVTSGRLPERAGEAVASTRAGFELGETVRVVGPGPAVDLEVVGLADRSRFSNEAVFFTSYETFEDVRKTRNPDAPFVFPSIVAVRVDAGASPSEVAERINGDVEGVEALTRADAIAKFPPVVGIRSSIGVLLLLAFIVVTLVIGLFFVILTVQKTGALTMLRAIGSPTVYLVRALVTQVVIVASAGIVIGAVATVVMARIPMGTVIFRPDLSSFVTLGAACLVLAVVASLAAVRRVVRVDPMTAATGPAGPA